MTDPPPNSYTTLYNYPLPKKNNKIKKIKIENKNIPLPPDRGGVNNLSKFQFPSPKGFRLKVIEDILGKGWLTHWIN